MTSMRRREVTPGAASFCIPSILVESRANMKSLQADLASRGWCVVHRLISENEVANLRAAAKAHFARSAHRLSNLGRNQPNFVRHAPDLAEVACHPRVLQAFRAALGPQIVFTGQSDLSVGRLSHWHKDSDDLGSPVRVAAARDFSVVKMALYLEDHLDDRGTFHVRRSSQTAPSLDAGASESVPLKAGDAVLFDVRLTHAGRFADPVERGLHRACRLHSRGAVDREWAVRARELWWRLLGRGERAGVFMTFGRPGPWTERFSRVNQLRQASYNAEIGLGAEKGPPHHVVMRLKALGVGIPGETVEGETTV